MIRRTYMLILLLGISAMLVYGTQKETGKIKPVKKLDDATLLMANYWRLETVDSLSRTRLQVYYLYGFLDAHTLWQVKYPAIKEFSKACEGMDISELLDMMNHFYKIDIFHPSQPAFVLVDLVPKLREAVRRAQPESTGTKSKK